MSGGGTKLAELTLASASAAAACSAIDDRNAREGERGFW